MDFRCAPAFGPFLPAAKGSSRPIAVGWSEVRLGVAEKRV